MGTVGDAEAFKALAHPLRVRILRHLDVEGAATASALAVALGTTSGTTSYHLRRLERHGFVEDDPGRASERERWWRWAGGKDRRIVFPAFEDLDDDTRAAARAADRALLDDDRALFARYVDRARELGPWAPGMRAGRYMTADQLRVFTVEMRALLDRHSSPARDGAPADARSVQLRFFAVPTDDPPTSP